MSILTSGMARIGIGALTGGIGGAAIGAASSMNSPAGRAFGMYQTGKGLFDSPEQPQMPTTSNLDQSLSGGQYDDYFNSLKRRIGYGGSY